MYFDSHAHYNDEQFNPDRDELLQAMQSNSISYIINAGTDITSSLFSIELAKKYPQCCRQIDDDEQGGLTFEIEKGRLSFRLTAPYSEERKQAASEWAKKHNIFHP